MDFKNTSNRNQYDENIFGLNVLAYLFLMPVILDLLNVIVNQFHLGNSSLVSLLVYIISLLTIIGKGFKFIRFNDIVILVLSINPFVISYFLFEDSKQYIFKQEMLIVYFFFFPLSVLFVKNIKQWTEFFSIFEKYGRIAVIIALIILLFLDYSRYIVYMGFSYALLPFISVLYCQARTNKKTINWIAFVIGTISILGYGARATILFLLVYILFFEITYNTSSYLLLKIILSAILCFLIYISYDSIVLKLGSVTAFEKSYIIQRILQGKLFEAETREILYESCRYRLNNMGWEISGFFGDRRYCAGFAYPHNIVYELLMSWGWVIGIIMLTLLMIIILKVCINKATRNISLFIVITCFLRYFVSGSYLVEGKFWLILSVFLALLKIHSSNVSNEIEELNNKAE